MKKFIIKNWFKISTALFIFLVGATFFYYYVIFLPNQSMSNKDFLFDVVHSLKNINDSRNLNKFEDLPGVSNSYLLQEAYYTVDLMEKAELRMTQWRNNKNPTIQKVTKDIIEGLSLWKKSEQAVINYFNTRDSNELAIFHVKLEEANNQFISVGPGVVFDKNNLLYLNKDDRQAVLTYIDNLFGETFKKQIKDNTLTEVFSVGIIKAGLEGKLK